MLRATSSTQPVWVIHPSDPAIDVDASDLLAYRGDLTEAGAKAHLKFKDGHDPTRWRIRALDAIEYDDLLAKAQAEVGTAQTPFGRRAAILFAKAGLVAVEPPGAKRPITPKQKKAWGEIEPRITHPTWVWLGERISEMTTGKTADPMLKLLLKHQMQAALLEVVIDTLEESGDPLSLLLGDDLAADVLRALSRPVAASNDDDTDSDAEPEDTPSGAEVPPLGESGASSSRASPTDGD